MPIYNITIMAIAAVGTYQVGIMILQTLIFKMTYVGNFVINFESMT